ncbi:hypothetical protein [Pedobacter sp. KBS0701]|uniref:hypothetical protein n=1 Tax=Pedobacter sp. KBS0701 TaxID=2578106 RepID=UPI00143DD01B|nr:hypothetical protein [Pedobacter sp. KBS0701]
MESPQHSEDLERKAGLKVPNAQNLSFLNLKGIKFILIKQFLDLSNSEGIKKHAYY